MAVVWLRMDMMPRIWPHARGWRRPLEELRGMMAENKVLWGLLPMQGVLPTEPRLMQLLGVRVGQGMLWGRAVEGQRRGGLAPMKEGRVLGSSRRHLEALLLPRPTESIVVVGLWGRESGHCLLLRGSR